MIYEQDEIRVYKRQKLCFIDYLVGRINFNYTRVLQNTPGVQDARTVVERIRTPYWKNSDRINLFGGAGTTGAFVLTGRILRRLKAIAPQILSYKPFPTIPMLNIETNE